MRAAFLLVALGACSFPEKELVDAGTPFGCLNAPNPTTADNPSVMSGRVVNGLTQDGVASASVGGRLSGSSTSIFVARTDATGSFRQSQNTSNSPLDMSLAVTANGFLDTYYYPPNKLTQNVNYGDIALITPMVRDTIASMAQLTFDPAKGHILMSVTDCLGNPLQGAMVSTSPAGTTIYFVNVVQPSPQATATDMGGVAMVANLPPGNVMLSGMYNGMQLKARNMQVVAGAFIVTQERP